MTSIGATHSGSLPTPNASDGYDPYPSGNGNPGFGTSGGDSQGSFLNNRTLLIGGSALAVVSPLLYTSGRHQAERLPGLRDVAQNANAAWQAARPGDESGLDKSAALARARTRFTGSQLTAYTNAGDARGVTIGKVHEDGYSTLRSSLARVEGDGHPAAIVRVGDWHFPAEISNPLSPIPHTRQVEDSHLQVTQGTGFSNGHIVSVTGYTTVHDGYHTEHYTEPFQKLVSDQAGVERIIASDGNEVRSAGTVLGNAATEARHGLTAAKFGSVGLKVAAGVTLLGGAVLAGYALLGHKDHFASGS